MAGLSSNANSRPNSKERETPVGIVVGVPNTFAKQNLIKRKSTRNSIEEVTKSDQNWEMFDKALEERVSKRNEDALTNFD